MGHNAGHNSRQGEIVDLRKVSVRDLEPLLLDEIAEWRRELAWDFEPSAQLVRKFATTNTLGGAALIIDGEVAGYGYAVLEEPRGIIGDLYVRPHRREPRHEAELFRSLLDALTETRNVRRMESQLMIPGPAAAALIREDNAARGRTVRLFERRLLSRPAGEPLPAGDLRFGSRFRLAAWEDRFLHAASAVIAGSYQGETDSLINDQYRSPGGARKFLGNIVEFPGCGAFHRESSFLAFDRESGEPAGMVLASFVARESGHISQLCVMPAARGAGLGSELLGVATRALEARGARTVGLTVTATNRKAISIYGRFGFRDVRTFYAYIWEG